MDAWNNLRPDIKAGVITGFVGGVLGIINIMTGGILTLTYIPESLILGILVVKFASKDPRFSNDNFIRLAFNSAFWRLFVIFCLLVIPLGLALSQQMPSDITETFLVVGAVLLLPQIILPPIGAWLYSRFGASSLRCGCVFFLFIVFLIFLAIVVFLVFSAGITAGLIAFLNEVFCNGGCLEGWGR